MTNRTNRDIEDDSPVHIYTDICTCECVHICFIDVYSHINQ